MFVEENSASIYLQGMRDRSMRSGTKFAREIQLTDWSTVENLSNRSSGVQIPRDICTRFRRYLYSRRCSWIIINNYSPRWRWIVVDIYRAASARKISTTFTDTEVKNCFSIYHTSWITSGPKSNFIYDNIPTKAILFLFGCSEVNSTWLITSKLANQRARKVLFTCVVYTNCCYCANVRLFEL